MCSDSLRGCRASRSSPRSRTSGRCCATPRSSRLTSRPPAARRATTASPRSAPCASAAASSRPSSPRSSTPAGAIPASIVRLTGITDGAVAGLPGIEGFLPAIEELLRDAVLVAHNARFDHGFLNAALVRAGRDKLAIDVVCTAALARRLLADEVRNVRLATLVRYLRCATTPNHRAPADAQACLEVFHTLLERVGSHGVLTLPDLLAFQRMRNTPVSIEPPQARRRPAPRSRRLPLPRHDRRGPLRRQGHRPARARRAVLRLRPPPRPAEPAQGDRPHRPRAHPHRAGGRGPRGRASSPSTSPATTAPASAADPRSGWR